MPSVYYADLIQKRALEILNKPAGITPVATMNENVASYHVAARPPKKPYTVSTTGSFTCTCRSYRFGKGICSHTVAVAEKLGLLSNLIR